LDANVKRVLARLFAIEGALQNKLVNDGLWSLAEKLLPKKPSDMPMYTQALMDFGATWCTSRKPVCLSNEKKCPFEQDCQANLCNQVLSFPQKTVKAKSPEFDCDMLLIRSGNLILLQKRPSKAIWGGLWSLPESTWVAKSDKKRKLPTFKDIFEEALPNESAGPWLKVCKDAALGPQIKHVFTHRRLWMQIWEVTASRNLEPKGEDLRWVPIRQLGRYGLPQPIKILLQGLNLVRDGDLKN
jgi:A/G-specific adenine glycosylase